MKLSEKQLRSIIREEIDNITQAPAIRRGGSLRQRSSAENASRRMPRGQRTTLAKHADATGNSVIAAVNSLTMFLDAAEHAGISPQMVQAIVRKRDQLSDLGDSLRDWMHKVAEER